MCMHVGRLLLTFDARGLSHHNLGPCPPERCRQCSAAAPARVATWCAHLRCKQHFGVAAMIESP